MKRWRVIKICVGVEEVCWSVLNQTCWINVFHPADSQQACCDVYQSCSHFLLTPGVSCAPPPPPPSPDVVFLVQAKLLRKRKLLCQPQHEKWLQTSNWIQAGSKLFFMFCLLVFSSWDTVSRFQTPLNDVDVLWQTEAVTATTTWDTRKSLRTHYKL